ncbi:UV-endonuclease UvdE-domain-containing protein, partial [Mrakia frigida]|uniref:UV-endonuclease UvdE-domain-containing protein n=1 Tax=Mrakia frigida TaxID=29902 RepID=UPI003FCC1134
MDPLTGEPLLDAAGKPVKRIPKPRKKAEPSYELGEDGEPLIGSDGEKIVKKKGGRKPKEVVVYEVPEVEKKQTSFKGRLGYACLNSLLRGRKPAKLSVFTSRTMRLATFESETGQQKLHDLTEQNTKDLCEILQWNADNNIFLFRLSSEMFPFASHPVHGYSLSTLPKAMANLAEAGRIAKKYSMRITAHPGQWTQLASPRQKVIDSAIKELVYHCEMMDAMSCGKDSIMVIHMGGVYDDKEATLERFKENYVKLVPEHVKARLVLENDEICYNVAELLPICQLLDIPLVLDYHHDWINPSPLPPALMMPDILATWSRKGIRCKQHLSEARLGARTLPERRGHSDRCEEMGLPDDVDLMIEAKDKEQAVLHLYNVYSLFPILNTSYLPPKP